MYRELWVVKPFADERGFAKTGWGSDKGQFPIQTGVKLFAESGTGDEGWTWAGMVEFCLQQYVRHIEPWNPFSIL